MFGRRGVLSVLLLIYILWYYPMIHDNLLVLNMLIRVLELLDTTTVKATHRIEVGIWHRKVRHIGSYCVDSVVRHRA